MELQLETAKLVDQHKYNEAVALCEQSIAAEPTVASNYWYLGLALLLQGQETEAQITWLSAIAGETPTQAKERTAELIQLLSVTALRHEADFDLQTAWVLRQYICEFSPDNFNNLLSIILLSIQLEMFQTHGKSALLQATQLLVCEENVEFNSNLLAEVLEKLLDINPFCEFVETCLLRKELVNDCQQVSAINNKLALAYNNLGQILFQQGSYAQAYSNFLQVIEIKHNFPKGELAVLNFNIGMTLISQGKFNQAISFFQKALELEPSFIKAQYQLIKANYEASNLLKGYQFTQDWFSRNIIIWEQYLSNFANLPKLNVLEIGSWEGRSTCWLLEHILTHNSARITCIDTFEGSVEHQQYNESYLKSIEERFDFNISKTEASDQVKKIVGKSEDVLRSLPLNSYDMVYIDGSHLASDVLRDAVLAWDLVKVGGLIVFDDYDFIFAESSHQNTKVGIDAFTDTFCNKISVIHKSYQVLVEKIAC